MKVDESVSGQEPLRRRQFATIERQIPPTPVRIALVSARKGYLEVFKKRARIEKVPDHWQIEHEFPTDLESSSDLKQFLGNGYDAIVICLGERMWFSDQYRSTARKLGYDTPILGFAPDDELQKEFEGYFDGMIHKEHDLGSYFGKIHTQIAKKRKDIARPSSGYDICLSYSSEDEEIAKELANALRTSYIACFKAEGSIPASADWLKQIKTAMRHARLFVLLATKNSLASHWVRVECGAAWISGLKFVVCDLRERSDTETVLDDIIPFQQAQTCKFAQVVYCITSRLLDNNRS